MRGMLPESTGSPFQKEHWEKNFGRTPGDWKFYDLSDVLIESKATSNATSQIPLCSLIIGEGITQKTERYNREFLLRDAEHNQYKVVPPRSIVFNPMNLRFGAIACSKHEQPVLVSGYYNVVSTVPEHADSSFLESFFSSHYMRYMYEKISNGSLIEKKRVHLSELCKLSVPLPPLPEQQKIARILSTWDKAIATVEKLIENSKAQKKALMQQLLTGTVRISGHGEEWKRREFSEVTSLSKAKWNPRSATESIPCVELEHLSQFTGQRLGSISSREQRSVKNLFRPGDVLFGKLRPYLRKYWLADMLGVCSTEIWVLRANREVCSPTYLFYLVQSERFIASCHVTSGSKMPRADWDYVSTFPFLLPSLEEQRVISTILKASDQTISRLSKRLTVLKVEKKALMQQLLTGKRRVKGDLEAGGGLSPATRDAI